MAKQQKPPPKLTREETREKLKRFLREGDGEDVASVLVHSLMSRADTMAEAQKKTDDSKKED